MGYARVLGTTFGAAAAGGLAFTGPTLIVPLLISAFALFATGLALVHVARRVRARA